MNSAQKLIEERKKSLSQLSEKNKTDEKQSKPMKILGQPPPNRPISVGLLPRDDKLSKIAALQVSILWALNFVSSPVIGKLLYN